MLLRLAGGARAASPSLVAKTATTTTTASRSTCTRSAPASFAAAAAAMSSAAAAPAADAPEKRLPAPAGAPKGASQGGLSLDPACYPLARRDASAGDVLHGVFCADPYRALEDPDSAETQAFVEAQNAVADKVLRGDAVARLRAPFKSLFERLYNYPRFSTPFKRGDSYYYYHNSGLQPQSVLYRAADPSAPHAASLPFLDPNGLSADGTVALRDVSFSEDGALAAYSLSDGGSDWSVIRVRRAADGGGEGGGGRCGEDLPDVLRRVKFSSIAWTTDGLGFFYCRYDVGGGPPPSPEEQAEAKKEAEAAAAAGGSEPAPARATAAPAAGKGGDAYDGTEVERLGGQRLYYHALGDPQAADCLIWEDPSRPDWMWGAECTEDGRFLALSVSEGCQPRNRLYVLDLDAHVPRRGGDMAGGGGAAAAPAGAYDFSAWPARALPFARVVDDFEGSYDLVANEGAVLYLRTNRGAPRYKVVKVDVAPALEGAARAAAAGKGGDKGGDGAEAAAAQAAAATGLAPADAWEVVIPQHPKDVLQGVVALKGDLVVARWLRDCVSGLELRALATGALLRPLPLPSLGDVGAVSGTRRSAELFFSFTSFVEPGATYRLRDAGDPSSPEPELFRATTLSIPHDPSDYITERLFATSKDGTKVPLFVTRHKSVALDDASNPPPCLLYGYGGFTISLSATFSPSRLAWMRGFRGVFAQANLRGGGEYGTEWRDAGSVLNKQNVFDDFCACAEALVSGGYAAPGRVAIQGGSNGGLLVAACLNQRPDLFGAGVAQVGVMDMLRFARFTIGHAWVSDYGDAEGNADEFAALAAYSPLHNVALPEKGKAQYPAVVLATGDHDDRVVPLHSLKLLAALQHAAAGGGGEGGGEGGEGADGAAGGGGKLTGRTTTAQRNPIVGRIEVRAGHGAGKPTAKVIEETSDLLAFAAAAVGATWHEEAVEEAFGGALA